MPNYHCIIHEELVPPAVRAKLAIGITDIHCELTGAPRHFVHVLFWPILPENSFSGGVPAKLAIVKAQIRRGRSKEVKEALLSKITALWIELTGMSKNSLLVALSEIPGENAMEFGLILPDPQFDQEWLEENGFVGTERGTAVAHGQA